MCRRVWASLLTWRGCPLKSICRGTEETSGKATILGEGDLGLGDWLFWVLRTVSYMWLGFVSLSQLFCPRGCTPRVVWSRLPNDGTQIMLLRGLGGTAHSGEWSILPSSSLWTTAHLALLGPLVVSFQRIWFIDHHTCLPCSAESSVRAGWLLSCSVWYPQHLAS